MYLEINRVINSTAFRRMQDKTMVYYSYKGDHYRTRLTHSIEVMMIAERIATSLKSRIEIEKQEATRNGEADKLARLDKIGIINTEITRAIALLHDIGHTPFGHIGERSLSSILCGKDSLGGLIPRSIKKSCFKHNVNSFRVLLQSLAKNERKTFPWQVYDGVCKHTKVSCKEDEVGNDPYRINSLIVNTPLDKIIIQTPTRNENYSQYPVALSIEGQVVAIADEIAQRISDFDDMVRAGDFDEVCVDLFNGLGNLRIIENSQRRLLDTISGIIEKYTKHEANGIKDVEHEDVLPPLQTFLINDVVQATMDNLFLPNVSIECVKMKDGSTLQGSIIYYDIGTSSPTSLISFGNEGKEVNKSFEAMSENKIIPSYEIRRCDSISNYIVRQLFKAYYNDPTQMSNKAINEMFRDVVGYCSNKDEGKSLLKSIQFMEKGNMFDALCKGLNKKTIEKEKRDTLKEFSKRAKRFNSMPKEYNECIKTSLYGSDKILTKDEFYVAKKIGEIFLRQIAYYIAGMTDSFALEEYKKLYGVSLP